ncbi:MAG TPA: RnfH family protein [Gaiellaceae bacterium]|nr:RnfH family protein [Gaiellaceae bacterium]
MKVVVAYAGPEGEAIVEVELTSGATLADAVDRSGTIARLNLRESTLDYAIFGQRASLATPLREGDRVELLRPLRADPKDARRVRAAENPLPRPRPKPKRGPSSP